jgi:hypothetical protein
MRGTGAPTWAALNSVGFKHASLTFDSNAGFFNFPDLGVNFPDLRVRLQTDDGDRRMRNLRELPGFAGNKRKRPLFQDRVPGRGVG